MSANVLLASLVVGSAGFGFFLYGKRQRRVPHLAVGLALMVFPYFVSNVTLMATIAAALVGLLALATYLGL